MFTRRKSEDTAAAAALAQRVHGVQRTCCDCGAMSACDPGSTEIRDGLGGQALVYGRCRTCSSWRRSGDVDRRAAALVLGLDRGDALLDGLRVDRFGDQPHALPSRPNRSPWAHVSGADLATTVERKRLDVESRHGGPCGWCGVGITPQGSGWSTLNRQAMCGGCRERFADLESGGFDDASMRTVAAAVVCGLSRGGQLHTPHRFGENLGLTFWSESGRTGANAWPWQHLDVASLRARVRKHVAYFNQTALLELLDNVPPVVRW